MYFLYQIKVLADAVEPNTSYFTRDNKTIIISIIHGSARPGCHISGGSILRILNNIRFGRLLHLSHYLVPLQSFIKRVNILLDSDIC